MEMENSALLQVMATQTSILEEIRELRRKEVLQGQQVSATSPNTATMQVDMATQPMASPISDMTIEVPPMEDMYVEPMEPYNGKNYYNTMAAPLPPMGSSQTPMASQQTPQIQNPLSYQSISKIPVVGGAAGAAAMTVEDTLRFDPSRMSREATGEYFAQRSRGVQMGAVEGAGTVLEGAGTIGGFMVGGLVGGLAVGTAVGAGTAYIGNEMVKGAEASLNYQDILRKDGYKAFNALESTTEYGGIGLSLDDQQELGGFMRDEAVNNFLDDDEMGDILQGALDNKLLKSVDDVKAFKEKFSGIVKTVKEISLTLDQTIDEAVEFMGEMERRGVGTDKMAGIAAGTKVAASFAGVDTETYTQQMLAQTDQIVSGSTMEAEQVMEGIGYNTYLLDGISSNSKEGDGILDTYIKNSGGTSAVAGQVESNLRSFYEGEGQSSLLAMFGGAFDQDESGNFSLNEERLDEMLSSGMTVDEMMADSTSAVQKLDETSRVKLSQSVGSVFNQQADSAQLLETAGFVQNQFQELSGVDMDDETALVTMGLSATQEDARLMNELIVGGSDPDAQNQFDMLTMKEEMDSEARAANPGFVKSLQYGWKKNVTNPIGDIGEAISNPIGTLAEELQMWSAGIEETGLVGGDMVEELTSETDVELFNGEGSNTEKVQKTLEEMRPELSKDVGLKEWDGKKIKFTVDQFEAMNDELDSGELTAADIKDMQENLKEGMYSGSAVEQVEYLINKATGEYDGASNKGKMFKDYTKATSMWNMEDDGIREGDFDSSEELANQEEEIEKGKKASRKELTKVLSGDVGVADDKLEELQTLVEAGDYDAVKGMTSDKGVLEIAKQFQGHAEDQLKLTEASELYSENFKNTKGVLTLTEGLYDFIDAANIHDEEDFDEKFGQKRKELKTKMKAQGSLLESGKLDDQEMADTFNYAMDERLNLFNEMSNKERTALAEELTKRDSSLSVEELYEDGSTTIDAEKLNEHVANMQRVQNTDESAVEKSLQSTEETNRVAEGHAEALTILTDTLLTETGKMQETVAALKSKNYGNKTGVSTGP